SIRKILAYLKAGKNVIANFPLKVNAIKIKNFKGRYFYVPNDKITVDYLYQFAQMYHDQELENQTLIMIDEASVKFNCRTYNNADRLAFCSFFAQHRKFGFDIILVCQNLRQIDRQIRDLIELDVIHRKLNNYSFYRLLPFPLFVAIEKNIVVKQKNDYEFFMYSRKIGNLYDTFYDFTRTKDFEGSDKLLESVIASEIKRVI
ncbi:MAG: zonular occludens toxin domain-containing protein, partial [Eubacterium sp.]